MRVRPLLETTDSQGRTTQITTVEEWNRKREQLEKTILHYLGEMPEHLFTEPQTLSIRIYEEHEYPEYRHLIIGYHVEPDDEVKAHLLIPPAHRRKGGAALLCQHGTSAEAKDTQLGAGPRRNRDFGRFFALNGFITLSPDHMCAGERQPPGYKPYDTTPFYQRYPKWSITGKEIWDNQRAIDVLTQIDEVDPERIGSVGHSLGGYGSIFLAAFEPRLRAIASSCGLTSWMDNPKRLEFSRDRWYVHFPLLREPFLRGEIPFDMHEFAALIAPKPFLNISGMADTMYSDTNENLPEIGYQLSQLYALLGASERFANFLTGEGHDVPDYARALMLAWFERWLCS